MSKINTITTYDAMKYEEAKYDINTFKNNVLPKHLMDGFFIIDKEGNEYEDNFVQFNTSEKNLELVIHKKQSYLISESYLDDFLLQEPNAKINCQMKIDEILDKYLDSKKNKIEQSYEVCKEIHERCYNKDNIKKDSLEKFQKNFPELNNSQELTKINNKISHSIDYVKEKIPKFVKDFETLEKTKDEVFTTIDKIKSGKKAQPFTEDDNKLKKIYKNNIDVINEKMEEIYNLKNDLNELVKKIMNY